MLTTATMRIRPDFGRNLLLKVLVAVYACVWIVTAIKDMALAFLGAGVCMFAVAIGRRVTGKGPYLLAEDAEPGRI